MALKCYWSVAVLAGVFCHVGVTTGHAAKDIMGPVSGLPMPRYVSLKSDHVNVRGGPTKDNDVSWVYTRVGLPVEITAEFENWRRVRDSEGSEGWVYHSLLSGKRTAVVTLKSKDDLAPLYDRADPASRCLRSHRGASTHAHGKCRRAASARVRLEPRLHRGDRTAGRVAGGLSLLRV